MWIPYACSALTVLGDSHWSMLSLIWGFGAGSVGKSRIARSTAPAPLSLFGACWNTSARSGRWRLLAKTMSWRRICPSILALIDRRPCVPPVVFNGRAS
uniref:Uncharacterized protein n=1 Tax=Klebsiella pneumoniae TaxID=573 RepID=A0A2P1BN93_KLEPN|nr:hypothetical protein [Klebsiella pneumoniae]